MESSESGGGNLPRSRENLDRGEVADRVAAIFAAIEPTPEDAARSEDEIIADSVALVAEARRSRYAKRP